MKSFDRLEQKWEHIEVRFSILSEWMESAQELEEIQVERLSDQVDELILLLADLGLEARQQFRQQAKPAPVVEPEGLSEGELRWLDELLTP